MEDCKKIPITQEEAARLYQEAGTTIHKCVKVFEESEEVVLDPTFLDHVKSVTSCLKLPFELQQFQLKVASILVSQQKLYPSCPYWSW